MGEKSPEFDKDLRRHGAEKEPRKQPSDDTKRALGSAAIKGASKDKR